MPFAGSAVAASLANDEEPPAPFACPTSSTISSYAGLAMKLSTVTSSADGAMGCARAARSWWVTTRS
jgi:hypothetical protein